MSYSLQSYLKSFEKMIILGVEKGYYTTKVPYLSSKLTEDKLKGEIDTDKTITISYYGIHRRGRGREDVGYLIHFSQIKIEHIMALMPSIINDFIIFKQEVINLRWRKNE